MAVKSYQKIIPIKAIQFEGYPQTDILEVVAFTGLPVNLEFTAQGISLSITVNQLNRLVVAVGDYVVKDLDGKITHVKKSVFETSGYQLVPDNG